jgi:hypothetical protein
MDTGHDGSDRRVGGRPLGRQGRSSIGFPYRCDFKLDPAQSGTQPFHVFQLAPRDMRAV